MPAGLLEDDHRTFDSREDFAIDLVTTIADTLQDHVGNEDAMGFLSIIAHRLGSHFSDRIRLAAGAGRLTPESIGEALVELKARIGGGFRVVDISAERIVLQNSRCPFGAKVRGRESLCMMTSGVFGRVTADATGYARVTIERAIARGDRDCLVVISLTQENDAREKSADRREYFAL